MIHRDFVASAGTTKDGHRIAIEIETGKSTIVENVKNCLRSGFERVMVIATDKQALSKVERLLGKAGLLIEKRVEVVLGGDGVRGE